MNDLNDSLVTRIWIIEDDAMFADSMEKMLNQTDDFVCEHVFRQCEDAIKMIKKEIQPDVVLMDIGLPGISGIEGVAQMKEVAPGTQFVMLTIYEEDEKVFKAVCAGATGYLVKNAQFEEIVEKLNDLRLGGAAMSPHIALKVLKMFAAMSTPKTGYHLSPRETEILGLMVEGLTQKQIADRLFISQHTVLSHIKHIYEKLHVHTCTEAVAKAVIEHLTTRTPTTPN